MVNKQYTATAKQWLAKGQSSGRGRGAGASRMQPGGFTPVARGGAPTREKPAGIPDSNVVARGGAKHHTGVYSEWYKQHFCGTGILSK